MRFSPILNMRMRAALVAWIMPSALGWMNSAGDIFARGLLGVGGELGKRGAAVAQLRGHGVEGTNEDAEFILDLFRNLIGEIAGGGFTRAFGKGLNRDSDLFGQEQGDPHGGGENQKSEEEEDQQHLLFQSTKILL